MAGFLDGYGAGDARREKTYLYAIGGTVLAAILGCLLYFQFRDFREARQVSQFLDALRSQDYKGAYTVWGCTEAAPCREYQFSKFMEDWGPQSPHANVAKARVVSTIGCDTGLISDVRFESGEKPVLLWASSSAQHATATQCFQNSSRLKCPATGRVSTARASKTEIASTALRTASKPRSTTARSIELTSPRTPRSAR